MKKNLKLLLLMCIFFMSNIGGTYAHKAQKYYWITEMNCEILVNNKIINNSNKVGKNPLKSDDAIIWRQGGGRASVYVSYVDKQKNRKIIICIERKRYKKIGAKSIGDYESRCEFQTSKKYIEQKPLKTKTVEFKKNVKEDNVEVIQLDSATFMDMFMPAVEVDTIGRYTVISEKGKLGVYDTWKKANVTPMEFDVLYYAQRVESPDGTRVLFIMQRKDDVGTVEVMEETNEYEVQIMAGAPKLKP